MSLREQMKADLLRALKGRQQTTANTLRIILGAIDNAEAVPISEVPLTLTGMSKDVQRKVLSEADIQSIIQREANERQVSLAKYEKLGRQQEAEKLRRELEIFEGYGFTMQ